MITVYCDGSITNHVPKGSLAHCWAAWYAVKTQGSEPSKLIHHKSFDMGENVDYSATTAEYAAIRSAMHWLVHNHEIDFLTIRSDSQVAIRQLTGEYNCHSTKLKPWLKACRELECYFVGVGYEWIPRESNTIADRLSKSMQPKYQGRVLTHEEVENLLVSDVVCNQCVEGVCFVDGLPQECPCVSK